jgi:hypothetical protein
MPLLQVVHLPFPSFLGEETIEPSGRLPNTMPVQIYVVDNSIVLFSMVAFGFTSALCEIISNPDGAREPRIVECTC